MKLRVGLAGLGAMGRNHARVLNELDGVELVAIADETYAGQEHLGVTVVATIEQLLVAGLDYAVIALPTALHASTALELCHAGVPVLIEKPLAHDLASAALVADEFERAGLLAAVGHIERFNPAVQQARQRITNGDLGDLYQVATRRQGPFPGRIADVGVTLDLGTHDLDVSMWLTGESYTAISAVSTKRSGREHEDLVAIVGRLGSDIIANHLVNWLSPTKERTIVITGDLGAFEIDTLRADLTFYTNGSVPTDWQAVAQFRGVSEGDVTRFAFTRYEPLKLEHEAFRDAVLGGVGAVVSLREGLAVLEVVNRVASNLQ